MKRAGLDLQGFDGSALCLGHGLLLARTRFRTWRHLVARKAVSHILALPSCESRHFEWVLRNHYAEVFEGRGGIAAGNGVGRMAVS